MKKAAKISKEVEEILKPYNEEIKDYIKVLQIKSDADIKRYTGVLSEEFQGRIQVIGEQYGDIRQTLKSHTEILESHTEILKSHTETLESHTEMIGKMAEDIEIIKSNVEFLKGGMKKKVDYDEFLALERRMSLLESKVK